MQNNKRLWFWLLAIPAGGALLAGLDSLGNWLQAWLAYTVLLSLAVALLLGAWAASGRSKEYLAPAITAFILRLAVGAALLLMLPVYGYANSAEHQAGYMFTDAYNRDNQAWELATSPDPLSDAFTGGYSGDQYGGLLALSAAVYRYISPAAHHPLLIVILGAAAAACGTLLLGKASQAWFGPAVGAAAAWIFALYPESVLLGSSQMREPFVLSAVAMTFYGLARLRKGRQAAAWWPPLAWLVAAGLLLFLIQPLAAFIAIGVLLGAWLLDPLALLASRRGHVHVSAVLLAGLLVVALLVAGAILANLPSLQGSGPLGVLFTWLQNNFLFQSYLTERASGMFQKLLDSAGEQWRWLIVMVYGIAQPVLPSVVGDPDAAAIMRVIGFLRAAGWYALAPFLVYGLTGALRAKEDARRLQLIWLSLAGWAWIIIAALNAGGDQWDNPRYRAILLAWQALLAAWAWSWARQRRDAWLYRWLAVEAVFVGMFTEWYASRYFPGLPHLDIWIMIAATLVITALILGGGWLWDRRRNIKYNHSSER